MPKPKRGGRTAVHRLPNYTSAYIPSAKLSNYLLDPIKEPNKSKAFNALGYDLGNADKLEADILEGLKHYSGAVFAPNEYGIPAEVTMELGITKRKMVRTGWMYDHGSNKPRFVTAYPD
jgi:hypothetical protein